MLIYMPIIKVIKYFVPSALLLFCLNLQAQESPGKSPDKQQESTAGKPVTGEVRNALTGEPVNSARVTYSDISAAITDSTGRFSLNVPDYNITLRIEAEGFQPKEMPLKGHNKVTAPLYESGYHSFYNSITTPFKVVAQSHLTNAAGSIQTQGNWDNSPETPDAYLQGKVAGLQVTRRSGTPNMGANLLMRGYSSLFATNQPLVIVDGVYFENAAFGGSLIPGYYNNSLSLIDVKDIENITVIKDGASIYGTKGANGVILITTARAKEEATKIDLGVYGGVNFTPVQIPVMDAADYRIYLSEMLQSKGLSYKDISQLPYMNDDINNPDYARNHYNNNWQDKIFKSSNTQNAYLKITGGDNIAKYALSIGYLKAGSTIDATDLVRYNTRFNADLNLSKRLTAVANLSFTYNEQSLKDLGTSLITNPIYNALIKAPFFPANEVADNGIESPSRAGSDSFRVSNPVSLIEAMQASSRNYRFAGTVGFKYEISPNLELSSTVSIALDKIRQSYFIPEKGVVNDTLDFAIAKNRSGSGVTRRFSFYNDTRLSYQRVFNSIHHFSAHAGIRYIHNNFEDDAVRSANSATDDLTGVGYGLSQLRSIGGSLVEWAWVNTYVNADYNLYSKYFLSFNLAADASSRFGENAADKAVIRFGKRNYPLFPSLSAAWLLSSEQFMADNKGIDLLKIRVSAGRSGNDDIGNYTSRKYYIPQNLLGIEGLVRANAGNPDLQWESVTKLNAGLDVSLFNERLSLSVDAYRNKTDNMVVIAPAPEASGIDYITTNSGAMKTTGWEAAVNSRILNTNTLKWDLGFTIAHSASTITRLPENELLTEFADGTILTRTGHAPNLFYGYKSNGIYASDAEALAAGISNKNANGSSTPFKGGDVRFADLTGDHIIDEDDRQIIGDPNPDFYGSISTRVGWQNWSLDALFTFMQGNDIYNYTRRQLESMSGYANQTQAVNNRWKTDGQSTDMPKATWGDPMGNSRFSDRWVENGSYFRLRTVSVSYDIPLKPGMVKYAKVYFTGNNLFTLTNYLGYDPEFSPTTGVIGQGVDVMLEPQFRSAQLGVRLGL